MLQIEQLSKAKDVEDASTQDTLKDEVPKKWVLKMALLLPVVAVAPSVFTPPQTTE
jgi:hypothetical protein